MNKEKKILLAILFFAVALRLINITMPILEGTATRQVQTAMIARNLYRGGFNVLYPQVDSMGAGPGYLVLEFPLLNLMAAVGYGLLGGVHEWVGRVLSIIFFAGSLLFLFGIAKRLFGGKIALWACGIFSFSPLSIIFSRTFMPDFEMLFFSMGAIYFMYQYASIAKNTYFFSSAIFTSLALLSKAQAFYIAVPLAFLLWQKERLKIILSLKNWLYLFIALAPAVLWYMHGSRIQHSFSPTEAYNFDFFHWFKPKLFFDKNLYKDLLGIYGGIFLTPIGLTLFLGGLFVKINKKQNLLLAWLFGIALFMFIFITHVDDPYYNLPVLPVAAIVIARMIDAVQKSELAKVCNLHTKIGKALLTIIAVLFIGRYALYAFIVPAGYRYLPEAGKKIQELAPKDALVIASSAGGQAALYYCDRKGWSFHLPGTDEEKTRQAIRNLEYMRKDGARFFVAAVMAEFNASPVFKDYVVKKYKLIEYKENKYAIFSLI